MFNRNSWWLDEPEYLAFVQRILGKRSFWLLFLVNFAGAILYSWRKALRDLLYWEI